MTVRNPQINIRVPPELKNRLHELAEENESSVNSEIVSRLERSILAETPITEPVTAEEALMLSNAAAVINKSIFISKVAETVHNAVSSGKGECSVVIPYAFEDEDSSYIENSPYKKIIEPVIKKYRSLGYEVEVDLESCKLNLSWG